ncbi:hypothetical protein SARC_08425 [Sphaeroforma arctica JP610]|uniref:Uncharacterized protein n=1 Tax=Sphaeroforma arctica JP610 TaxID=667725 RepID=A0A0L0FRJ3_9EUKA|nr:hypothetical protein SARC_08425 [Sphaeroforma arctica JP610]KNC79176.1 hypothetical protein SARC_08425 [Sphaeroforma arctica JP610]|eukprot:XP_014153078.1 hypothetical protein SARC_08425 [Sphaeroforma arctica JP610]
MRIVWWVCNRSRKRHATPSAVCTLGASRYSFLRRLLLGSIHSSNKADTTLGLPPQPKATHASTAPAKQSRRRQSDLDTKNSEAHPDQLMGNTLTKAKGLDHMKAKGLDHMKAEGLDNIVYYQLCYTCRSDPTHPTQLPHRRDALSTAIAGCGVAL